MLRSGTQFACGRLRDTGGDLASQPTISRWENAPDLRTVIRLGWVLLDVWIESDPTALDAVTLNIDDTVYDVLGVAIPKTHALASPKPGSPPSSCGC